MDETVSFNLIDEPWICVRDDTGTVREVSLLELFSQAPRLRCLANDLPTLDFAIRRLLLAILQRAISPIIDDLDEDVGPAEFWGRLWEASELPMDAIEAYLIKWHDRFDLFDQEHPFMQIPDLKKVDATGVPIEETSSITKIMADVPDGEILFSLKSGDKLSKLSFSEAARWLVHVQAFDTSGIKSGVFNDPLSSGSRSLSKGKKGVAWAGQLGGIYFEGDTLQETLLLNLVLWGNEKKEFFSDDDLPVWEKSPRPFGSLEEMPTGTADIYTWQSRRTRLAISNNTVSGVVLTYGDVISAANKHKIEPMTSWETPAKNKHRKQLIYNPIRHQSDKALWRGLSSIFQGSKNADDDGNTLCSGVVSWVEYLTNERKIHRLNLLCIHSVGLQYDSNYSIIIDLIDDRITFSSSLLSSDGLRFISLADKCVRETESAIECLSNFAKDLCRAAGGDSSNLTLVAKETSRRAYFEIDAMFRTWFAGLCVQSNPDMERASWRRQARSLFESISKDLLVDVNPAAIIGSPIKGKAGNITGWMTAGKAKCIFSNQLKRILPLEGDVERKEDSTDEKLER